MPTFVCCFRGDLALQLSDTLENISMQSHWCAPRHSCLPRALARRVCASRKDTRRDGPVALETVAMFGDWRSLVTGAREG